MALEDTVKQADTETPPGTPGAPAATETTIAPDPQDPDFLELEAARKGAPEGALEQPAKTEEPAPAAPAAKTDAPAAPAAPAAAAPAEVMIPKARFDQELGKSHAKDQTIAALRGEIEALKLARTAPAAAPAAPDAITSARGELKALAKRFDDGEISQSELEDLRTPIEDKIWDLRQEQTLARMKESLPAPPAAQDLLLDERTSQLEDAHPYTKEIESLDDWKFLHRKAVEELTAEGYAIPQGELAPREQLLVRERIAVLTDKYGELLTGKKIELKPAPASPAPARPGVSATAAARSDKLDAAGRAPPDISRIGSGGTGDEQYTEARILSMDDEELGRLPASIRRKFLPTE